LVNSSISGGGSGYTLTHFHWKLLVHMKAWPLGCTGSSWSMLHADSIVPFIDLSIEGDYGLNESMLDAVLKCTWRQELAAVLD